MTTASDPRARDGSRLSRRDWTIIICGALVLVASFLPWEAATSTALGGAYSSSASAWNAGFAAWFGSLLCAAAAAAVAARHLGHLPGFRGMGPNVVACGLAVAGLVLLAIRLLTLPRSGSYGPFGTAAGSYGYGPSFGAFAGVGLAAVQFIVALLSFRASGEKLPSFAAPGPGQPGQPGQPARPGGHGQPGGYGPRAMPSPAPAGPPPAASAIPPAELIPQPTQPYEDQELARRLARLDDLRARQMISDAEYAEQRRRIISQL
jgi:hypothetical protein